MLLIRWQDQAPGRTDTSRLGCQVRVTEDMADHVIEVAAEMQGAKDDDDCAESKVA